MDDPLIPKQGTIYHRRVDCRITTQLSILSLCVVLLTTPLTVVTVGTLLYGQVDIATMIQTTILNQVPTQVYLATCSKTLALKLAKLKLKLKLYRLRW